MATTTKVQTIVEDRLDSLEARVTLVEGAVKFNKRNGSKTGNGESKSTIPAVTPSPDADLDSEWGDPLVRYDPFKNFWGGDSYVNFKFSQCPADYLRATAAHLIDRADFLSGRGFDGDKRKASFALKDAARALGWALRVESGNGRPAPNLEPASSSSNVDEDSLPF